MTIVVLVAIAFAAGFAASIFAWPALRAHIFGLSAEIATLRARARALETTADGRRR